MTVRIGINGFGRIGRQVLKAFTEKYGDTFQVVAINDLFEAGGPDGSLLPVACYESGPWQAPGTVAVRVEALRALAKAAGIAT